MMKKHFLILCTICFTVLFCACNKFPGQMAASPTPAVTGEDGTMPSYLVIPLTSGKVSPISACSYDLLHTVTTIQIYDKADYDILYECFAIIDYYEKIFSRTLEGSEVYRINHSDKTSFTVSDELRDILTLSLQYSTLTDGAFDASIAPVSSLWDFTSTEHRAAVPEASALSDALSLVGYENITLSGNHLSFTKEKMQLEFGAIAKGYVADRVKEFLVNQGVTSAIINLGGNILLIGEKPDGSAFNVGIQQPFADRDAVVAAVCKLRDLSMVSSGIYERYFYDTDGTFYHHILNPHTGYPCENDLLQVTIISESSAVGDALSTSCFALGMEKGMELIHSLEHVYAVFMTTDGKLHFSDGFSEHIPTTPE